MDNYKRGDIFYVMRDAIQTGAEIYHGRPAIIVSNDILNATSSLVEVVFLTTQPKKDMGTHVRITSTGRLSTALCEQITTVAIERLGNYIGTASDKEMREIDMAIGQSLSLSQNPPRAMVLLSPLISLLLKRSAIFTKPCTRTFSTGY